MSAHDTAPTGLTIEEVRAVARTVAIATVELIAEEHEEARFLWRERIQISEKVARKFVGCEMEEPEWTRERVVQDEMTSRDYYNEHPRDFDERGRS